MKNKNKYIGIKELLEESYDVMMHECINNCSDCKYGKIVKGKETKEQFEGVVLMINSPDNYCYLTFEELEYLCDTLERLDFDTLALQLINLISNYDNKIEEETIKPTNRIETQETEEVETTIPIQPLPVENTILCAPVI